MEPIRQAEREPPTTFDACDKELALRLRRALVARYGVELGNDACADALAYGWEHRERLNAMANPAGYLYRVAQSSARRYRRWEREPKLPAEPPTGSAEASPDLATAIAQLKANQRIAIVLVHAHGYSYADAADVIGVPVTTLRNDLHRGLRRLRKLLEKP